MDTPRMETGIASANALHRMLRQGLLAGRFGPVAPRVLPAGDIESAHVAAELAEAGETMPMLYRSEAFAEDLFDPA